MLPPPKPVTKVKTPISLCLIGKNEAKNIPVFWKSVQPLLVHPRDEVVFVDTGSTDKTVAVARRCGWRVIPFPGVCSLQPRELIKKYLPEDQAKKWKTLTAHGHYARGLIRSFAEARNRSFQAARNKVCLWLDLDDVLQHPQFLRPYIDHVFGEGHGGAIMLKYEYAHAEDGQCTTVLWRERVVSKEHFEWRGPCHETLCPREGIPLQSLRMARDDSCPTLVYHQSPKKEGFSDLRNYLIMRNELDTNEYRDPRTLFYLGNACRGLRLEKEALRWYGEFVQTSGSGDDMYSAYLNMGVCCNNLGRPWQGLDYVDQAIKVSPHDPRGYYFKADAWFRLEHWRNAITNIKIGDHFKLPDTLHAVDPNTLGFHPAAIGALSARELGETELAVMFAERAAKERPNYEEARKGLEDMQLWARAEEQSRMAATVVQNLADDPLEVAKHIKFSPHMMQKGVGSPESKLPGDKSKKQIAFYCGHSAEYWGPNSLETGIGASEKMVYELARALAKLDYNVCVYCTLSHGSEERTEDGVHWRFTARFNPKLYRDHLFIWRMPMIVDKMPFNAGRIYVWMHDVGSNSVWTPDILERVDKVLFLSKFQRAGHPAVPEEKVFYTRNGVNLEAHRYDGREKKKKIIFCSSPDRGFQSAIRLFNDSGLAKYGWELHMFYGFSGKTWRKPATTQEFGHIVELKKEMRMLQYEDDCLRMVDESPGVVYRGRVGWKQMAEEFKESWIWLYPTHFDEISCVAAMEAMAGGCVVISTDHAALKETLKDYPLWINLSESPESFWWELLANWETCALEDNIRDREPEDGAAFAQKFDIAPLARRWAEELLVETDNGEPDDTDAGAGLADELLAVSVQGAEGGGQLGGGSDVRAAEGGTDSTPEPFEQLGGAPESA
jgi:glycosyltransferase involved in cell wall biosynthesis